MRPSYTYKPPRTTSQSLFTWGLFSTGLPIFLPAAIFYLIIFLTPVEAGAEEDVAEGTAFLSWALLTTTLLLSSLSLYVSSFIAYLRHRHH